MIDPKLSISEVLSQYTIETLVTTGGFLVVHPHNICYNIIIDSMKSYKEEYNNYSYITYNDNTYAISEQRIKSAVLHTKPLYLSLTRTTLTDCHI